MQDHLKQLEALLDDYFVTRSIDDTDLEARLPALFLAYGADCAARERQRTMQTIEDKITEFVSRMNADSEEYYSAVCFHLHQLAAAIRALT